MYQNQATFKIKLDISTQLMIEEITNCPVNASKQNKRKKKKTTRISTLAFCLHHLNRQGLWLKIDFVEVNKKYKVLIGDKEKHYWNLSSLEKC